MLKRFHKQLLALFAISSLIILISGDLAIAKKGTKWHVYSWMELDAIQALVDGAADGDTIYFHAGTYNWSEAPMSERAENTGAINIIDKTLTIKGEEGAVMIGRESVDGAGDGATGVNAFHVEDLDTNNDVTFDGLTFQTFLRGVSSGYTDNYPPPPGEDDISVPNLRNLTVKNCVFSDIHRDAISISYIGGNVLIQDNDMSANRHGLFLSWYWSEGHTTWQPEDTYIRFLENNVVAGSYGLGIWQTTNVIVKQNTIECNLTGMVIDWTREGAVISDNTLFNCNYGIVIYGDFRNGVEFEAEGAVVEKNELSHMRIHGITLYGDACYGHTVSKNKINMEQGSEAGIFTRANDNYFGQNNISGSGLFAFLLSQSIIDDETAAYHETLQANNVNKFSADACHFYFGDGTHDNLIVGSGMEYNTYYDGGTNNRITGAMPMAGGIGRDLSETIKKRNEELREARKINF